MTDYVDWIRRQISAQTDSLAPDDFAMIPTTRGLSAIVDRQFSDVVSQYRWFAVRAQPEHIYAVADIEGRRIALPRLVLTLASLGKNVDDFKHVSFKNKISFDCRLSNLEYRVGRQAVMRNRKPKRNTSSQYKGVMRAKRTDGSIYWRGQIKGNDGTMSLGSFEDEVWAATVYDAAAYLLFGGAGYSNFPDQAPSIEALDIARARIERFRNRRRLKNGSAETS
ncbi:hypothetical protein [Ruegeria sp. HKCCD6119]|uniref:hypothetical protein n=1 Tax=Ruegeria sp. HKCCD6119 TaxID=2683003 RepID=UPI0014921068|nr:hypothetical protein [Ruegeria sp. HKCCD6119]NOD85556.1 hypothetical protein [Ruegeria sp. HKCCD6119]